MTANTVPIWARRADVQWTVAQTAANTNMDGTGTVATVFTGDATEGSFLSHIRAKAAGTNVATVARFFLNNGSTNATAANNVLIAEVSLAATTASATTALIEYTIPINSPIPAGYKVNVTLGTAVAAGWVFSGWGGDY